MQGSTISTALQTLISSSTSPCCVGLPVSSGRSQTLMSRAFSSSSTCFVCSMTIAVTSALSRPVRNALWYTTLCPPAWAMRSAACTMRARLAPTFGFSSLARLT